MAAPRNHFEQRGLLRCQSLICYPLTITRFSLLLFLIIPPSASTRLIRGNPPDLSRSQQMDRSIIILQFSGVQMIGEAATLDKVSRGLRVRHLQ